MLFLKESLIQLLFVMLGKKKRLTTLPVEIKNGDDKYVGTKVKAVKGAYSNEAYENDGLNFNNLTITKTKRVNLGKGCENTLMFQFENQKVDHWFPAKHFKKI